MISPGQVSGKRDTVLGRIRAAMAMPTDPHVVHSGANAGVEPDRSHYGDVLPVVEDTWEAKLAALTERSANLKTNLIVVDDCAAMTAAVQQIVDEEKVTCIGYQHAPLVSPVVEAFGGETVCVDDGFDKFALEKCDVGISGCFAIVAHTGSVAVTSHSSGGRALTVLPPHHIVLATADQVVTNLPTLWAQFAASPDRAGSMISLISGPSRTGDIERILVLGAHGPKKQTIILQRA